MHFSEFRARVLDAFERSRATPRSSATTGEPLDRLLADLAVDPAHLTQFLGELPTLVIHPVYVASLYDWAFRQLQSVTAALGQPELVINALRPLLEVGTVPRWTWFDLARELEAVGSPEAVRLLRWVPVQHRERALRDDTPDALAALERQEPALRPTRPVDLSRITTFHQARALAGQLLPPEIALLTAIERCPPTIPDELIDHVQYDGLGAALLALAADGRRLEDVRRVLRAGVDALCEWLAVSGRVEALPAIETLQRHVESERVLAWWADVMEPTVSDPLDAYSAIGQALARAAAEELEDDDDEDP